MRKHQQTLLQQSLLGQVLYEKETNAFYYWEFCLDGWNIRTDIECYSSLRTTASRSLTDADVYPLLKYCKNLKALDLGHNRLTDLSYLGQLTDLEVLILADNPTLVDASPLANLKNLQYLEFFLNENVEDYSFLNSLTKLKDLNLCYSTHLTNMDFLDYMPDMEFLLLKLSGVRTKEFNLWKDKRPDVNMIIYDGTVGSCDSGWRSTSRNAAIRKNFSHWQNITAYRAYNDTDIDYNFFNYTPCN